METKPPDNTALRTALWRALHLLEEQPPFIFEDRLGYELIQPSQDWREKPDMKYTRRLRAAIVGRARFIEDLALRHIAAGFRQYLLLGAGLDGFAQRHTELRDAVDIYEIDQPDTLAWKAARLQSCGYKRHANLHYVAVDFEKTSWWTELLAQGFLAQEPAVVTCTGVTLYLSRPAIKATLKTLSGLAPGSRLAVAFYLPLEQMDAADRPLQEIAIQGAAASGTPFVSFFSESEVIDMGRDAGLKGIRIFSGQDMKDTYFKGRKDDFYPASGEFFLLATV